MIEEPSKEDGRLHSKASVSRNSHTRKSFISGRSYRTLSNENTLSPKSRDGSPFRSSVGGSKKKYDVILGDPEKIYPNGNPSIKQFKDSSQYELSNKSYKLNSDLRRQNSPSDVVSDPTRGT